MKQTAPFLVFRFLIYFGITLGFTLITGTGAGIGYGIGLVADSAPAGGMWGGLFGFGIASAIMYFIREYLLYIVKAGHIAVLVELAEGRPIPGGKGQIAYARERVQEQFIRRSACGAPVCWAWGRSLRSLRRPFYSPPPLRSMPMGR